MAPESSTSLVSRRNSLYREAEDAYLALPKPSEGPAFDTGRVSEDKVAYVVGRLEGLSVTQNEHSGDLLGEFFEQIVSRDFTQTKGQFFTPVKVVRFMLALAGANEHARDVMLNSKDHLGRPRLPYVVIDPACGSGTFLIEYMKTVGDALSDASISATLPRRVKQAHEAWFGGSGGNRWAREFLFGIENNYDLGLAAKVNMVLHGDGSMNTWIMSALNPFADYAVEGRNNVLGVQVDDEHPYGAGRNEQFDLVLSNPPFSLTLSPDERARARGSFEVMAGAISESVVVERWYQLLRDGGRFCCVLPESILDTSSSKRIRAFLLGHFRVLAVVSLPYDAFRPFTSTKTSIVLAEKRTREEVAAFAEALVERGVVCGTVPPTTALESVVHELGWADDKIFMAEPLVVGYKRRKNLPDLPLPNPLYRESAGAVGRPESVLDAWEGRSGVSPKDPVFGFSTTLGAVVRRAGFRLDPKYRWLWDFQDGGCSGSFGGTRVGSLVDLVELARVGKGELTEETLLIDLDQVESRQGIVREDAPRVDVLGSDRIRFAGSDLAISKLEPYLGKVIICPDQAAVGSTEWVGLKVRDGIPPLLVGYLLMLPRMCECLRRLQSGKRHARLDPEELLELTLDVPPRETWAELVATIEAKRAVILGLRVQERAVRGEIDAALGL